MRLCAYWDCMEEVDEGMSFCREHGMKLNRQLIDKCPKCGRYKDTRQKFCPDCNYGRPVADWKVSSRNLDEITEYSEPSSPEIPAVRNADPVNSTGLTSQDPSPPARGEAMCPSCGSPNLIYKNTFDYFRCNDCETTFITPVYSYGEAGFNQGGTAPSQPVIRESVQQPPAWQPPPAPPREPPPVRRIPPPVEPQPVRWEEPSFEQQPMQWEEPAAPVKRKSHAISFDRIPNLDIMRRHEIENRSMNLKALKMQGQGGKLGWIYLLVVLCIVALIALLGWVLFNEQIAAALESIF